ncbi:MAG TPA: hypothetical protein VNY53_05535 [Bradyrhizobium sp.]|jgi:hypothetical protein|nr:hypothetical protein [Bradyrhizobium sp.]
MNNPIPLEYLTSFSQTSQAMMQQLATGLLTSGDNATNFTRYSELALTRRHAGAGTHAPGQHRLSRDRDGARPLRHGARRLNQIWRLEEENHD